MPNKPKNTSESQLSFFWGACSSAHQVEGGNHNDWTEWENAGHIDRQERSGLACDHYHRFREDFALAKSLGHTMHRFSIEWSRVAPKPGVIDEEALEHYRQVLEELRRLDIEPMVTLHHFTLPVWVAAQGGWESKKTVDDFGKYVLAVVQALGPYVKYWITVNEPTTLTTFGYIGKLWPPYKKNYVLAWQAIRHLVSAHQLAYQIIHRYDPSAKVGAANNLNHIVAARPDNILDRGLRAFAQYWHNQWWLDQTYVMQDFLGVNYYFRQPLQFKLTGVNQLFAPAIPPDAPKSDMGWWISPEGLGSVLELLRPYQRPIIITENGIADADDSRRADFIRGHVSQIKQAATDGIDIRGYLYWSLTDNFEWTSGFAPRFGLVAIDYDTQARTVRPSAEVYKNIIAGNGVEW